MLGPFFNLGIQVGLIGGMIYFSIQGDLVKTFCLAATLGLVGIVSRLDRLEKKIDALSE